MSITLRPYQKECVNLLNGIDSGSHIVRMATGLGKTICFTQLKRNGRTLLLSHREELVTQPLKYYSCRTGVEMASRSCSPSDEVVSASVMSLSRRLNRFNPYEFDTIIVDECHHSAAQSYRRILDYFEPNRVFGFTATPNRSDGVRLDNVFDDIIFDKDLRWGIENGYLSDIYCKRAHIGYDLSQVHSRMGDYAPGELEEAMDGTADAIAEVYKKHAVGPTLIFAVSVNQANEIATKIPGSVVVTADTKNRAEIIHRFTAGEIKCIVNIMVFTEGTDLPLVETIIIARPTQSDTLYAQMVGRGLRMHPGKERLNLIDCVGVTGKSSLRTAPTLLGVDLAAVPENKRSEIEGLLFELPEKAVKLSDTPESWIRNVEIVNLWAKEQKYVTHGVNWFKLPDGRLMLSLKGKKVYISCQDDLGQVVLEGQQMPMQRALDLSYRALKERYSDQEYLWNLSAVRRWGKAPASEKQKNLINRRCPDVDISSLSKMDASLILNRVLSGGVRV